jgi:protein-S-isoprenylcysteine O-methyltransferase Ste14
VLQLDALMDKVYLGSGSSGVASWGVGEGVSVAMRTVALVCAILGTVGAVRRIRDEERALRVRFKGEWEAWAGRVRYRLVPGVY